MTRVLVCGGRNYADANRMYAELSALDITCLAHGGARGADWLAHEYTTNFNLNEREFPADWEQYGKAAGPIRNQQMLDEFKPELVVAFPGGKGTAHMVAIARKAGVPVREVSA